MSKFERHKKKGDSYYVYPHKHCKKCDQMIDESFTYCPPCYAIMQEKKKKKRFRKKKDTDELSNEKEVKND